MGAIEGGYRPQLSRAELNQYAHRTLPVGERIQATQTAIDNIANSFPGLRDHRIREVLKDAQSPNEVSEIVRTDPLFTYIK